MSIGKTLLDTVQHNVLGNIEKAVIEILDIRDRKVTVQKSVPAGGGAAAETFSVGTFSGTKAYLMPDTTYAGVAGLSQTLNDPTMRLGGSGSFLGVSRKLFHVQFNPSTLTFTGYGGGMVSKMDYTSKTEGKAITLEPASTRIAMNVSLIFDKVDPQDAFLADKLLPSATSVATGVAKAVKTIVGKADHSVQTEVEGFIAALRSTRTTRLTFHWGKMNYTGVLNRVSAQYTMFNVLGVPIRAVVNLSMVCADQEVSPSSMGAWQKYYNEAFGGKSSVSNVAKAQKASSLMNFTL